VFFKVIIFHIDKWLSGNSRWKVVLLLASCLYLAPAASLLRTAGDDAEENKWSDDINIMSLLVCQTGLLIFQSISRHCALFHCHQHALSKLATSYYPWKTQDKMQATPQWVIGSLSLYSRVVVFSTAFELRGADLRFFSCAEKMGFFWVYVLLLKFDGH
jgi:hypothetical protein